MSNICFHCDGNGLIKCTKCEGEGYVYKNNLWSGSEQVTCDWCLGLKKLRCGVCGGVSMTIEYFCSVIKWHYSKYALYNQGKLTSMQYEEGYKDFFEKKMKGCFYDFEGTVLDVSSTGTIDLHLSSFEVAGLGKIDIRASTSFNPTYGALRRINIGDKIRASGLLLDFDDYAGSSGIKLRFYQCKLI